MPGKRALRLAGVLTAVQTTAVLLSARAFAAPPTPDPTPSVSGTLSPSPSPSKDECRLIVGDAKEYCERGTSGGNTAKTNPGVSDTLDPLSSLAKGCADAASWTVKKLSEAVKETANVDFTNEKFLQQYAVVFAASTVLTLVLWLLAVAKRAVRGVPLGTAI
ncbi:MAG TPA: hypothetical protein VIU15_27895, partial [Streptomyces sp.]